jgi:cytochrome c551/c552
MRLKPWLAIALVLTPVAVQAQRSAYGPSRLWWDAGADTLLPWEEDYENPGGQVGIRNTSGAVHTGGHAFFQALGANGRACVTCHQPSNAMSLSTALVRQRWEETTGKDPLFAAIDGSNCPGLPQEAKSSHSLLLERGLFRIPLAWPPAEVKPEFRLEVVKDPTGCNTSPEHGVSVYRRPRIAANFDYVATRDRGFTFMADGREPSLRSQAISAVLIHEQAAAHPTEEQLLQIVEFESQIYTAQSSDLRAGLLFSENGPMLLGPENLKRRRAGTLDSEGTAWKSFEGWKNAADGGVQSEFRASVARGSALFTSRTCATCHSTNSGKRWMDVGTANHPVAEASPDLPLFKITCDSGKVTYTQDPGRALITGKCADVGAIGIQQFRGLAARPPYFSNGSAETLRDVVEFYDRRLHIGLTETEKQDLTNFLSVL